MQDADIVFSYAIDAATYKEIQHLRDLGHKIILISEYMEQFPIDKAKWIFPMSLAYEKENLAEGFMDSITDNYLSLKNLVRNVDIRPSVFMGFPWKGTWYMSGGKSFQANFFKDAAGNYKWSDSKKESGMPLNMEQVFAKALDAEIWINPGSKTSLSDILKSDERFEDFFAFENKSVFNNDFRTNTTGGNDYWESGVVRPDLILADLIKIFHPEIPLKHDFVYYRRLK